MQLKLTLYKKWFVEILFKRKKVEYRKISKYYETRLSKRYDSIKFINGYGKDRPFIVLELNKIEKTEDNYNLYLGDILEVGNLKKLNKKDKTNRYNKIIGGDPV